MEPLYPIFSIVLFKHPVTGAITKGVTHGYNVEVIDAPKEVCYTVAYKRTDLSFPYDAPEYLKKQSDLLLYAYIFESQILGNDDLRTAIVLANQRSA